MMNDVEDHKGDTIVHYASVSCSLSKRKRLNDVSDIRSEGQGARLFQNETKRNSGKNFLVLDRQYGRKILEDEPLVALHTRS